MHYKVDKTPSSLAFLFSEISIESQQLLCTESAALTLSVVHLTPLQITVLLEAAEKWEKGRELLFPEEIHFWFHPRASYHL